MLPSFIIAVALSVGQAAPDAAPDAGPAIPSNAIGSTMTLSGVTAVRVPYTGDAASMAAEDATSLGPAAQACFYVFVPKPSRETTAAYTYAFNCAPSYAATGLTPDVLYGGYLLRFDLKKWCPGATELNRVASVLAGYRDDYFYVREQGLVNVPAYRASDGKTYTTKLAETNVFVPHIEPAAAKALKELTGLQTPIVYGPRWIGQSLRTLEGGIYYKLRGYDTLDQKGWLATLGGDEAASEALQGNSFSARLRGKVTDKARRGVLFYGRAARPAESLPLIAITQDIADGVASPDAHPIYSLLDFKFNATELIGTMPNNFPTVFLANAKGERQDVVPPDIAKDHTIPSPHTGQLEPLLSCGRCHGPDDFWKPFPNDVQRLRKMLTGGAKVDVFGDLTRADQIAAVDEIAGKYAGKFEDIFILARNSQERSCFRATGMGISECWEAISLEWQEHYYEPLTARRASFELGWSLPENASDEQAAKFFRELVPVLPPNAYGVSPEDPVVASLCDYLSPGDDPSERLEPIRADWERIYRDPALRSRDAVLARIQLAQQAAAKAAEGAE